MRPPVMGPRPGWAGSVRSDPASYFVSVMAKRVCCAAMSILALLLLAADSAVPAMQPAPAVPSLLQSGIPEIPAELKERGAQYLNARPASLLDVSDDGAALLVATR